ncbi:MAG: hypothetical protein II289_00065 [Bacteroidales bacterium]|nr:hypothetical protein [Bacteroidales bacterium]
MRTIDMRVKCWLCEHCRTVNYADGSSSIGCLVPSKDGYPVDIRFMEACPRGHSRRCQDINRQDLMQVIGRIYVLTSASPGELSLYKMVEEMPSLRGKKTLIGRAIIELGILQRLSNRVPGHRGVYCLYRWNAGSPPSLEMCDRIIFKTEELTFAMVQSRKERVKDGTVRPRPVKISKKMIGITPCAKCRLNKVENCRERLLALGYDCKKVNVNMLPDEVTMGFEAEDK